MYFLKSVVFVICGSILYSSCLATEHNPVIDAFNREAISPDLIPKAPEGLLTVQFEKGIKANLGNTLSIEQSKKKPVDLSWPSSQEAFYTVVMTDPDAPSRRNATFAEFKHWIVGNVPGLKINEGKIIADYRPPSPPKGTGPHRYILLVFVQPRGKITFKEPFTPSDKSDGRPKWSVKKFAQEYDLGDPVAGNFFFVERKK
ncbi:protein D3-like [Chrysoperla carnea]|uniref:protein D3-like n=1 Tax=Chrysoperla carnea TaxID=189513 RepID=UPI001D062D7A|nr:protein D3-like [Chrysoperla carnea]